MRKRYLITALITGVVLTDVSTLHYFSHQASASIEGYQKERKPKKKLPKKPVESKVPPPEVYRLRTLIAQAEKGKEKKKFETKVKDFYYSLQLATFKKKENAEKFLKKLPPEIRENSFIYVTDKGYYTVRYGLFDNYKLLKEIQENIPVKSIIVKTDVSKVVKEKVAVEKVPETVKKIEKKVEKKPEIIEEETKIIPEFEEEEISIFEEEKPQIPLYKKVIGAVFFVPAYMLTHKQRGFWGRVEFTYKMERYKDPYRKTSRNSFRQYYELNYEGYIYSPRLLTYTLGGNFSREDSKIKYGSNSSDSTSKLIGYNLELNFLKGSRFPINLFAKKTESPLWYTYYDRSSYTERKTDSYGLYGNLRFVGSQINYSYRHEKSKSVGLDFREDRKTDEYNFSFGKFFINKSLNITLKKNIDDYTQEYASTTRKVYQDINNYNLNYRWKISKKSNLSADARYYSNSYTDLKDFTGNINYLWNPSDRLTTNFGLSATRSEGRNYDITFLSFNESLNYVLSENWNLSHNLILFTSNGSQADQKLINTGVNLNYHKTINEKFSIFGGTGVSGQAESGNINRVGGTVSLNAGLIKRFDFLDSSFSLSGSTSQYKSSKDDRSNTFNINERYTAFLSKNLRFEHTINYYYQDSQYYRPSGGFSETNYDNLETSNSLRYKRMLGWKGSLTTALGVKYYYGKKRAERFYPFGNMALNYRFTRNLLYKLSVDVHRDTYYNTTYSTINSHIDYKYRRLNFRWDFQYYYEDNDNYGKRHNYITAFKIYRVF
ncbi:Sporulation related domain-containing protein [Persephonella hydrogeniphila]|uniref:Sporulation related domain-containing protein n=1 Tax=Persephonella hydrogeniphila TaxID=198703 RepID=A0A285NP27_9AQUI|nr:SPOR domain-containing protein [Persephonella hydrogeniphila]SNZ11262.1 Sporulation related domain-containing protein [Persephonella hydrogeniphila]